MLTLLLRLREVVLPPEWINGGELCVADTFIAM
jgi:hypothetical protein